MCFNLSTLQNHFCCCISAGESQNDTYTPYPDKAPQLPPLSPLYYYHNYGYNYNYDHGANLGRINTVSTFTETDSLPSPIKPPPKAVCIPALCKNKHRPRKLHRRRWLARVQIWKTKKATVAELPPQIPSSVMLAAHAACESVLTLGIYHGDRSDRSDGSDGGSGRDCEWEWEWDRHDIGYILEMQRQLNRERELRLAHERQLNLEREGERELELERERENEMSPLPSISSPSISPSPSFSESSQNHSQRPQPITVGSWWR